MFDESGVSWSAAADVRRFAHCQLSHGPDSRLGWGKRNAFLISGRARQFAWLCDPTASLVFHIRSWNNIKVKLALADIHISIGPGSRAQAPWQKQIWVTRSAELRGEITYAIYKQPRTLLFDELFNCVLQTIYCGGAQEAPTLSFSEGREDRWWRGGRQLYH